MRLRKKYQNGGRPGDPLKVDSLGASQGLVMQEQQLQQLAQMLDAEFKLVDPKVDPFKVDSPGARQGLMMQDQQLQQLAQMLDAEFNRELEEKMRLRDEYGVYADDAAGLPSIDPFLALTAAGDAEAIGSGLSEIAGGDLFTGAGNVMLGAASVAIPGTLPKIKNIRGIEVTKRDLSKDRIADMFVEDNAGIGKELGSIDKSGLSVEGEDMYEAFISGDAAKIADDKEKLEMLKGSSEAHRMRHKLEIQRLEDLNQRLPQQFRDASHQEVRRTMALATNEMLDAIPIGGKVGSVSLSSDSYPIILKKWAKGQLSAKKFDGAAGEGYGPLNSMGQKYKNSREVEDWHWRRHGGDEEVVGYSEFGGKYNSLYAPAQQMEFEEFVQVDPAAMDAFWRGNKKQADNLYEKYTLQADNDLGISYFGTQGSKARLSREEAQELANKFDMRMRQLTQERSAKQSRMLKRGDNQSKAILSDDMGIPPVKIVEDYMAPGYYTIEYPQIPFHRNFEEGGKFKIKRQRPKGMQVKR